MGNASPHLRPYLEHDRQAGVNGGGEEDELRREGDDPEAVQVGEQLEGVDAEPGTDPAADVLGHRGHRGEQVHLLVFFGGESGKMCVRSHWNKLWKWEN